MINRNYTIDIIRMVAALVVMIGHLLHIKGSNSGFLIGTHFESILSSGAFAVVVFFGLSGIALRFQTDKFGLSFRWLAARFIRLIPVYWVTFLLPFFGFYLLGVHFSYSWYGFVISVFGLQALFHNIAVPPANGPLWSLSVEIYLSASLVVIGFWRRQSGFLCLLTLILAAVLFPKNLILQGLPIFYFGYLLPSIRFTLSRNLFLKVTVILVPLAVLILAPKSLQGRYNESVNFFICFIVAGLILIASLVFAKLSGTLLSTISQRSYSLYATHAPILYFCDREFFSDAEVLSGKQVLISLFLIIFSTEILYRIVEVPSIKYSRKYLNSRQGNSKTK